MLYYNRRLKNTARTLRKNMTDTEKLLWSRIRRKQLKGYQFYRQKTIGNYIVDFYCPSVRLIIELDGNQHYDEEGMRKDKVRDRYLTGIGLQVMRFPSTDVFGNIDGIVDEIYELLPLESPQPPLKKGEKEEGKILLIHLICALGMLLETLGEEKAGKAIESAVINIVQTKLKDLAAGKMGYTTEEIGDMVAAGI